MRVHVIYKVLQLRFLHKRMIPRSLTKLHPSRVMAPSRELSREPVRELLFFHTKTVVNHNFFLKIKMYFSFQKEVTVHHGFRVKTNSSRTGSRDGSPTLTGESLFSYKPLEKKLGIQRKGI